MSVLETATALDAHAGAVHGPLHPVRVMAALNAVLPTSIPVFCDIGNTMAWALRYLVRRSPYTWHVNLAMGSMGHALPAAIGAVEATREPAVVLLGDAAFKMCGFELHTAAERGLPVYALVLNDNGHGMVEIGARLQWPDFDTRYRFRRGVDCVRIAEALGVLGTRARSSRELRRAVGRALTSGAPALIEVPIDPRAIPPIGSRTELLAQNFGGGAGSGEVVP